MNNMELMTVRQQSNQLVTADPAAVAAAEAAKQRLQAAYMMAAHRPRNQDQARQNLLAACRRLRFAEKAEYSKPVGGGMIKGPSIRFAETALREWGNVMSDIQVVYEDERTRRVRVVLVDLETNAQFTKELTIAKVVERKFPADREVLGERLNSRNEKVFIVKATDDEIVNKEAAAISKAVRNEGLRLIPGDIIDEAMDIARETIAAGVKSDPESHKRKMIDSFGEINVKVKHLEDYLGHSLDQISQKELLELRQIFASIKDGETSWSEVAEAKRKESAAATTEKVGAVEMLTAKKRAKKEPKEAEQPNTVTVGPEEAVDCPPAPVEPVATALAPAPAPAQAVPPNLTKGQLLADVMDLLKRANRDQIDLIRWCERNKHIASGSAENIQQLSGHLLQSIAQNWEKIVL